MLPVVKFLIASLRRLAVVALVLGLTTSSLPAQQFFNDLESADTTVGWIGLQTIDTGFAHSGEHFSRVDENHPFGLGIETLFPENLRGKNVRMEVSGWVYSPTAGDQALFVVSLKEDFHNVYWDGIPLNRQAADSGRWTFFYDTLLVPADVTASAVLKAYLWNNDGKHAMAIDDLSFSFSEVATPSFFPEISLPEATGEHAGEEVFSGYYYRVFVGKSGKKIQLVARDGTLLTEDLWFVHEKAKGKKRKARESVLKFREVTEAGNQYRLRFRGKGIELVWECRPDSPEIKIQVTSKHNKGQKQLRRALLLRSVQPVSEVYRSNRKTDRSGFQQEYWLDRQGVKFGEDGHSLLVYHPSGVSSLQLKPEARWLLVNLDYDKDHPFLHFPLDDKLLDVKEDWSASRFAESGTDSYSFSLFVGTRARNLPRLMKNPDGFLATYIWTEHADWTDIRTNRATYFGSENVRTAAKATGGFVFYNIPVTKSVFWDNPDSVTLTEVSGGRFTGPESTIRTDTAFSSFLQGLQQRGYDICLHTPEQNSTTRSRLEEALGYMQRNFASPSWIDHGYNNKTPNNREDLICDGSLEGAALFVRDLWEKYGVNYFWNAYYEEYFPFSRWRFGSNLGKPYPGFGDFYPKPDFWRHPTRTSGLVHWPTTSVLFVPQDYLWEYYFSSNVLSGLVDNWGVEINHCYPAWVTPQKGFWVWSSDSTVVAAPGFNRVLQRMADLRDLGKLNVTTIRDFLNYRLAVEQLVYEVLPDGSVRVTNPTEKKISGLAFATPSCFLLVDGLRPAQKTVGDEVIFWFDLEAGESKRIRVFE